MARVMKDSGVAWIGEIPEGWIFSRIKYISDFEPACDTSLLPPDAIVTYTPMECIKNGYYIPNSATWGSLSSSLTPYQEGDIVMAKVTPCFENGNIAIMTGLSSGIGFGSSELFVFRPKAIDKAYLFYWLQNEGFKQQAISTMTGTGGLKRVSPAFVRNCAMHIPYLPEQSRIAAFLDRRCAEIDRVIAATQHTIEEYKKLKQSIITEAVTHGVRGPRKMKDSGVEWIGEIPEEWHRDKVCRLFRLIGSGTTPKSDNEDYYSDGTIHWIQSGDINGGLLSESKALITEETLQRFSALKMYDAPFIIMAMYGASIGNVSISTISGCVNQACCVMKNGYQNLEYSYYALKTAKNYLIWRAVGGGQPNISQETIRQLWLPYPPNEEQTEIVTYLNSQCAEIDRLIESKQRLLTELESYKKSVIYEYVTGKKEVPDTQEWI